MTDTDRAPFRDSDYFRHELGIGKTSWHALMKQGVVPKPIKVGGAHRWTDGDVAETKAKLKARRDQDAGEGVTPIGTAMSGPSPSASPLPIAVSLETVVSSCHVRARGPRKAGVNRSTGDHEGVRDEAS